MTPSSSPIRFSAARRAQYDEICDDLIQRALEHHDAFHSAETLDRWKPVRHRDALSVYKDRIHRAVQQQHPHSVLPVHNSTTTTTTQHRNSDSSTSTSDRASPRSTSSTSSSSPFAPLNKSSLMMCSGLVRGTIDDILTGLFVDTTERLRVAKSILNDRFLDGAVVHVFTANAVDAPVIFAGIKWWAMKVPGGKLLRDRDILAFERMGHIVDARGQRFAYHVLQSIELPEWPAATHGLMRVDLSLCYLYRRINADWIACFMVGDVATNSATPQAIAEFIAADKLLSVGNTLVCAHAQRFSALIAASADRLASSSPQCDLCLAAPPTSPFRLIGASKPQHKICNGCKRRVCRTCRSHRVVFRLNARTRKPETERFCRACVDRVVFHTTSAKCVDNNNQRLDEDDDDDDDRDAIPVLSASPRDDYNNVDASQSPSSASSLSPTTSNKHEFTDHWPQQLLLQDGRWNKEELKRLGARLGASSYSKKQQQPRNDERSVPFAPSSSSRFAPSLSTAAPRMRSGTTTSATGSNPWSPRRSTAFDPQCVDPAAAYESFKAAVARTQPLRSENDDDAGNRNRSRRYDKTTTTTTLLFNNATGQYEHQPRERQDDRSNMDNVAAADARIQCFSIDELD